jgi:hypothetical protein
VDVEIAFQCLPRLSYAMAHNRVPVLGEVRLSTSLEEVVGAVMAITVADDEGPVSHPFTQAVDLAASAPTRVLDPAVRLNPAAMLQVRERRPATVTVEVSHDGRTIGTAQEHVELLAGNQWLADPPGLAFELLTAFVLPNDPAIALLLDEAAVRLQVNTGSSSMDGYQSGNPERVDQVVRAIWEACQARSVRYAEPPASWADVGQKVRTPADVLEGGVGTCLDTTVALAAALEQAGIRPLIWVLKGHAFLGYWREETALDAIVYDDAREVMNDVDLERMRLVETTAVAQRETPIDFGETHRLALKAIEGDLDIVLAIADVWSARQTGVVPVPVRRQSTDGTQIIEYQPAVHSQRALVITPTGDRSERRPAESSPPRIQQWKNSLLDLSLRNRLINYSDRAGVRIRVADGRLGAIEDLIHARKALALRPLDQIEEVDRARGIRHAGELPDERVASQLLDKLAVYTDVSSGGYTTRMRGLAYKARTIQEETGANNLYLALGSLAWSLDGKQLRSPLILVPVRLTTTARGALYRLELDESGGSTPNYCLLEKLRQVHGLSIPGLAEPGQDDSGIDLDAALHHTRRAIAAKGLPFRVEATADLSILQFAKFRLWKDLDEHWQSLMQNSLVRHLVETPTEPYEDPVVTDDTVDLDALDASCPVPADASQLQAVAAAVSGQSFVLEGPPGTGKSQTITNLLTRAVADGKRVLFVAEKRAALDVVSSRLESVGMGAFSLDLHDKASKPAAVRAQIKQALDHAVDVDVQGLAAQEEDLRSSRRTLARYAQNLHAANAADLSYYSARTALLTLGADREALQVPMQLLARPEELRNVRNILWSIADVADPARPAPDHPWGFTGLTEVDSAGIAQVIDAARAVDAAVSRLLPTHDIAKVLAAARTPEDFTALSALMDVEIPLAVLDTARGDVWQQHVTQLNREIAAFVAAAHPGLDVVTPAALDLPVADLHARAQAADASGFFGRGKRRKGVLAQLQPALRPGAQVSHRKVSELTTALVQVQGAVHGLAARASGVAGVVIPASWNPFTDHGRSLVERQTEWLAWAGRAVDASKDPKPFTSAVRDWLQSPDRSAGAGGDVRAVAEAFRRLADLTAATPGAMSAWSGDRGLMDRWQATAPGRQLEGDDNLPLRRWVALNAALAPLRKAGLHEAAAAVATGVVAPDNATRAFDRGVALASLGERRQATGLDGFDPESHDRVVRRFTTSSQAVRRHMRTAVPRQVLDARPFAASTARGQVGELQRELAKQRRGLGVRALMEKYGELITQVMPCVLVSPDSVARFFPVGSQVFDLVVFDEASQIRVADAIGSIGRARAVVVVGDSKQMPPTSFAEPASGVDDDAPTDDRTVVEDEESILSEAVLARVPRRWLTWHYRSQDESLIAFSNQHYYEDRLSSFPAPSHGTSDRLGRGVGVTLVRVNGSFLRSGTGKLLRTNPAEAEAIFAEIRRRFDASPDAVPSLGVVTFNQQQRTFIEGLIRDSEDERLVGALDGTNGEGLFVKNLENVQGDERDVILFSTAFSKNDKGVLPLNFGPLTRAGGERRLNVAVTRARRQVIVYSSFDPRDLRVEQTQSVGIHHLRAYLEMANHGSDGAAPAVRRRDVPDRHRDEIAAALGARGLSVLRDVGLSDFRIDLALAAASAPDEPLVAVLLDGPGWAGRRTVGDRDGLPLEVLGHLMGWPAVERIWTPSWVADPESNIARLLELVGEIEKNGVPPSRPQPVPPQAPLHSPTPADPVPTFRHAAHSTPGDREATEAGGPALPGETAYTAYEPRWRGGRNVLDALPDREALAEVRKVIDEVVADEGPVHVERIARLVAASFELTRLNQARIDSLIRAIPQDLLTDPSEPFAWPVGTRPDDWAEFRRANGDPRALEHVSLREIGNAMIALAREGMGMTAQELTTEALAVFGGRRKTTGIQARLDEALEAAVQRGKLRLGANELYHPA